MVNELPNPKVDLTCKTCWESFIKYTTEIEAIKIDGYLYEVMANCPSESCKDERRSCICFGIHTEGNKCATCQRQLETVPLLKKNSLTQNDSSAE